MTTWPAHPAAELFLLLPDAELAELADDIRTRGLNEPVWLYDDPDRGTVLLDGRNRVRACEIAGVPVRTQQYRGDDPIGFVISENVRRRHLDAWDKASLADALMGLFEEDAEKARRDAGAKYGAAHPKREVPEKFPEPPAVERESRERAAKVVGTAGRNVSTYRRIKAVAPDLVAKRAAQDTGERITLGRAERIIRDREAEARRVAEAQEQARAQPFVATVDLRHGDFREVLADLTNIDAIITDPPYPREFLPLLDDLAAWADKVLAPDGVLAILFGQTYLPEVYRRLDGHRPYRWTGCYLTPGGGYVSRVAHVQSNWKPVIVYGGGPRFADTLRTEGSDANAKSLHKWGQDYSAFHTLIERLTKPGQTVCDPFAGSGTTLLAAKALGRHAVGAEIDPEHIRIARERVA